MHAQSSASCVPRACALALEVLLHHLRRESRVPSLAARAAVDVCRQQAESDQAERARQRRYSYRSAHAQEGCFPSHVFIQPRSASRPSGMRSTGSSSSGPSASSGSKSGSRCSSGIAALSNHSMRPIAAESTGRFGAHQRPAPWPGMSSRLASSSLVSRLALRGVVTYST